MDLKDAANLSIITIELYAMCEFMNKIIFIYLTYVQIIL
jgi:hypothetical protein